MGSIGAAKTLDLSQISAVVLVLCSALLCCDGAVR